MGVGLLYHLTKEGWNDIVLVEKGELTSGSTWHAAGLIPHFIGSLSMQKSIITAQNYTKNSKPKQDKPRVGMDAVRCGWPSIKTKSIGSIMSKVFSIKSVWNVICWGRMKLRKCILC